MRPGQKLSLGIVGKVHLSEISPMEWGRGITNVDDFEICRGQRGGVATVRGLLLTAFEMKHGWANILPLRLIYTVSPDWP